MTSYVCKQVSRLNRNTSWLRGHCWTLTFYGCWLLTAVYLCSCPISLISKRVSDLTIQHNSYDSFCLWVHPLFSPKNHAEVPNLYVFRLSHPRILHDIISKPKLSEDLLFRQGWQRGICGARGRVGQSHIKGSVVWFLAPPVCISRISCVDK